MSVSSSSSRSKEVVVTLYLCIELVIASEQSFRKMLYSSFEQLLSLWDFVQRISDHNAQLEG